MIDSDETSFAVEVAILLLGWLFIGIPFLDNITMTKGVLVSYPLFLVAWGSVFGFLGGREKGRQLFMVSIALFIIGDIVAPPILVPWSGPVSLPPESTLASDVFFYTFFTKTLGLPHALAWLATYIGVPIASILTVAHAYGYRRTRSKVLGVMRVG